MARATTILLVDADHDLVKSATLLLENEGYRVVTARDGEEALLKLREGRPDLVLLDILLPKRNGYQVCRALKEDRALATLPVLFVSAKSQPSDRFWARRVGGDGFVAKPYDPADLLREVKSLLQKSQQGAKV
jgi:DNA-binding response OmpR family regulator